MSIIRTCHQKAPLPDALLAPTAPASSTPSLSVRAQRPRQTITNSLMLPQVIAQCIMEDGYNANLNHLDVSHIIDFSNLFNAYQKNPLLSKFCGDISQWDVSNAENMSYMFHGSLFNGNLSQWDVRKVKRSYAMFYRSHFDQDLSTWSFDSLYLGGFMFRTCPLRLEHFPHFPHPQSIYDLQWLFLDSTLQPQIPNTPMPTVEDAYACFNRLHLQRHLLPVTDTPQKPRL